MPFRTFIAGEETSVSVFKASKYRLNLLLGASVAGDFKLKPMLVYYSKNLGPLRIMLNVLFLCSVNETTKPG